MLTTSLASQVLPQCSACYMKIKALEHVYIEEQRTLRCCSAHAQGCLFPE